MACIASPRAHYRVYRVNGGCEQLAVMVLERKQHKAYTTTYTAEM